MNGAEPLSFKKTYRLKAQSPLIHFQHNQWGSALRASEVKPRFDRFLLAKLEGITDCRKWFSGNRKSPSFDYKMHITAKNGRKVDFPPRIFYSEITVDKKDKTRMIFCDCRLEITCFVPELLAEIDRYIGEFFVCSNFGRMQSKGFGSFLVDEKPYTEAGIAEMLTRFCGAKACYAVSGYDPDNFQKPFDDILTIYGIMKSGCNLKDYHRSYLFEYCHEVLGVGNEKAALKEEKISPWDENGPIKHPEKEDHFQGGKEQPNHYVRALLGVGEQITYLAGFTWGTNRRGQECWRPSGEKVSVKIENGTVDRLASPIFFKIIGGTVYMVAKRVNPVIYQQEFVFKNTGTEKSISLTVPEGFDIDDFLDWFVVRYNKDSAQKNEKGYPVSYSIGKEIVRLEGGAQS